MEYRYLGKSGLQVSALSYGAWVTFNDQFAEDTAYDCMVAFLLYHMELGLHSMINLHKIPLMIVWLRLMMLV